jgi:hypothetical protein
MKSNMEKMYNDCRGMGWHDKNKMKELQHDGARFILCRDAETKLVAFAHVRFLREPAGGGPDCNQLYVYVLVHWCGFRAL